MKTHFFLSPNGEEIFGEQRVQVANRVAVEADVRRVIDEQLDGRFVVEDHLRLARILACGALAEREQPLGFEQRVGVAFEAAGVPGEVDEQPVVNVARIRARGQFALGRTPGCREALAKLGRKIDRSLGR